MRLTTGVGAKERPVIKAKQLLAGAWPALTEVVMLMGGDAVGKLLMLLSTIYLARVLEPELFGYFALGQTVSVYLALLVEGGLGKYEARLVSQEQGSQRRLRQRLSTALLGRTPLAVVVALLYSLVVINLRLAPALREVLLLSALWVLASVASSEWLWQGLKRTDIVGIARVAYPALYVAFVMLSVKSGADLAVAMLAKTMAYLIVGVVLLLLAIRLFSDGPKISGLLVSTQMVIADLRGAFPLLLTSALISLYSSNLDLIPLQVWRAASEVGIYAAAYRLYSPLSAIAPVLVYFWFLGLCKSVTLPRQDAAWVRTRFAFSTLAVVIPICMGLLVFGDVVLVR